LTSECFILRQVDALLGFSSLSRYSGESGSSRLTAIHPLMAFALDPFLLVSEDDLQRLQPGIVWHFLLSQAPTVLVFLAFLSIE
jgi:hypothetical protein